MQDNQLADIVTLFKETGFKSAKILVSVIFIITVIGNITLYQIACHLIDHGKKHDSKERAVRRLLDCNICCKTYAKLIDTLFSFSTQAIELAMDRTNWKLGKTAINLFILSFNWNGIAIPLYWVFLDNNGGNSNSDDRKKLIDWFISQYGNDKVANLYADREFPSARFLSYLLDKRVNFVFRIKDNILIGDSVKSHYSKKTLKRLFRELSNGNYKAESHIRNLLDNRVFIAAKRNSKGELIVLVSNQYHKDPFALYAKRWNIEVMFNKFKTSGFNLEHSHITNGRRILNLFAIISLAYVYSCYIGNIRNQIKPIKQKLINNIETKSVSLFRYGFDLIKHILAVSIIQNKQLTCELLQLLMGVPIKPASAMVQLMSNF